jgi:hypothetical protein
VNRWVRLLGINCDQIGHFEEIAPGDWRGVDYERSAGICVYTWEMLITRIADLIGGGVVHRMETPKDRADIDRARNIWIEHAYLAPHEYLPRLIPEAANE